MNDRTTPAVLLSTSLNAFVLALQNPTLVPTSGNDCILRIRFQSARFRVSGRVAWFNGMTGVGKIAVSFDCVPEMVEFVNELHAVLDTARGQNCA